jgi:hypothetical protein
VTEATLDVELVAAGFVLRTRERRCVDAPSGALLVSLVTKPAQ